MTFGLAAVFAPQAGNNASSTAGPAPQELVNAFHA